MKTQIKTINKRGETALEPLVKFGKYGLHVIKNPAGSYRYVGSVPQNLVGTVHQTEDDAINAIISAGYVVTFREVD